MNHLAKVKYECHYFSNGSGTPSTLNETKKLKNEEDVLKELLEVFSHLPRRHFKRTYGKVFSSD